MVEEGPRSGGDPQGRARCTECRKVYPVQRTGDDRLRPIGTGGSCDCGNAEFERVESYPPEFEFERREVPGED